jgi:hypothetical protein
MTPKTQMTSNVKRFTIHQFGDEKHRDRNRNHSTIQPFSHSTMLSDKTKILLLSSLIAISLLSLFTSNSFDTQSHGVGTLRMNPKATCMMAQTQLHHCQDNPDSTANKKQQFESQSQSQSQCKELESQLKTCQEVSTKAYQYMNLSACIREIQATSVCKVEWCSPAPLSAPLSSSSSLEGGDSCRRECKLVNDALNECEKEYLHRFFHKAGLNPDGTFQDS